MKVRHLVPFAILLAWQAAPDSVEQPQGGRYRLSVGLGSSHYLRDYDWFGSDTYCSGGCEGGCTTTQPYLHHDTKKESSQSGGVHLEAWPSDSLRIAGSAGSAGGGALFGGLLVAWEGRQVGLGGGYAGGSDSKGRSGLSGYLRLGDLDRMHARAEVLSPSATWGTGGWSRLGLGYNLGRKPGVGFFLGYAKVQGRAGLVGAPGIADAAFLDFNIPLGGPSAPSSLLLRGHLGHQAYGLGAGIRFPIGR